MPREVPCSSWKNRELPSLLLNFSCSVMTGEGLERRDKRKGVARPIKRQRQAPKYVLRLLATLPIIAAPSPSSMGLLLPLQYDKSDIRLMFTLILISFSSVFV
ncbi:hypothetical protein VIGAN_05239600, partial [Vigna angularis var. angularis]